jgi:hypothetical protein
VSAAGEDESGGKVACGLQAGVAAQIAAAAATASMPAAMPSSRVDLPLPFSPTRKVTGAVKTSSFRSRTSGNVHGKAAGSSAASGRRRSEERKTIEPSSVPRDRNQLARLPIWIRNDRPFRR